MIDWNQSAGAVKEKQIDKIDRELREIAAQQNVVSHRLLTKILEADEQGAWSWQGYISCVHYLSYSIGLSASAAREHVRVAHALAKLPKIDAELASGALSYSKVRALTRIAKPESEAELLDVAHQLSAAQLEKLVRGWQRIESAEDARKREESRSFQCFTDMDGMVVINVRLLAEEGAAVRKAIESVTPEKGATMVDAFVRMAERALRGEQDGACAADRHQIVVAVDAAVLSGGEGSAEIEGVGVSAEVVRRVACDSSVVAMAYDKDGKIVSAGRKTRTVSTPLRRRLRERDEAGCRFPGCTNRFVDAHHVKHWADGGETTLENLVSLCRAHHRCVHEMGYSVAVGASGEIAFRNPWGFVLGRPLPLQRASAEVLPAAEKLPVYPRLAGQVIDWGLGVSGLYARWRDEE